MTVVSTLSGPTGVEVQPIAGEVARLTIISANGSVSVHGPVVVLRELLHDAGRQLATLEVGHRIDQAVTHIDDGEEIQP